MRAIQIGLVAWLACAHLEFASNTWHLQRFGLRGRRYESANSFAVGTCKEAQRWGTWLAFRSEPCREGPVSVRSPSAQGWPAIDIRYRLDCDAQRLRGSLREGHNFSGLCLGCIRADFDVPCALSRVPERIDCDLTARCMNLYLPTVYDSEWSVSLQRALAACSGSADDHCRHAECLDHVRGSYDPRTDRFVRPTVARECLPYATCD